MQENYPYWIHRYSDPKGHWIYIPSAETRKFATYTETVIKKHWNVPYFYYHLQKGGHIQAIKKHFDLKKNIYFSYIDISNFYGCITRNKIIKVLKKYIGYYNALDIAQRSTTKNPGSKAYALPYGFPQSPLLASFVLDKSALGQEMRKIATSKEVKVSLFMDDLLLSSANKSSLIKATQRIIASLEKSNFLINTTKSKSVEESIRIFNIHIENNRIAIEQDRLETLISSLLKNQNQYLSISGTLGYINSVSPSQKAKIITFLKTKGYVDHNSILWKSFLK